MNIFYDIAHSSLEFTRHANWLFKLISAHLISSSLSCSVLFRIRLDFLHFKRDHMRKQREDVTMQPLNCRIELEVEPYRTLIGDDTSVTVLQGNGGWGGGGGGINDN